MLDKKVIGMTLRAWVTAWSGTWSGAEDLFVPDHDGPLTGHATLLITPVLAGRAMTFDYAHWAGDRALIQTHSTVYDTGHGLRLHWIADQAGEALIYHGQAIADGLQFDRSAGPAMKRLRLTVPGDMLELTALTISGGQERPTRRARLTHARA